MGQRNVGIDILRILLALMVIAIHFNAPATGHVALSVTGPMKFLVLPMVAICYPAVNTYVLICGYFSFAKRKNLKQVLNSLFKLWFCLLFFSLLGYVISILINENNFNFVVFLKHFLPVSRGVWWYMTVYFVLMLLSPLLNMIVQQLSKKDYLIMMFLALLVCSIIPFFLKFDSKIGLNYGYGLIWFVVLYLTGAGLSKYYLKEKKIKYAWYAALWYFVLTFYLFISAFIYNHIGMHEYTSAMYNSIVVYGQSVSLFVLFFVIDVKDLKLSKIISFIAGLSLAAYILHCQEDIGPALWKLTEPYKYADSIKLIPLFLEIVLGMFFAAIIIEYIRKRVFNFRNFENRTQEVILQKITNVLNLSYDFIIKKKIL